MPLPKKANSDLSHSLIYPFVGARIARRLLKKSLSQKFYPQTRHISNFL